MSYFKKCIKFHMKSVHFELSTHLIEEKIIEISIKIKKKY